MKLLIATVTYLFCLLGITSQLIADDFVRREGNRFMLDGKSFHFSGANQYYLFYKSKFMVDDVMEKAKGLGLQVMRTWAFCDGEWHGGHSFQPEPGVYHEETFRKLDYVIYKAQSLGIRLVLSLVNNWDSFGGMQAYVRWSKTAKNHDDFYSDPTVRKIYKDYITFVLNRVNTYTGRPYKDDPTIMMWELANEPRVSQARLGDFYAWIDEMAAHVKSIDKNHLLSTGSEGNYATDLYKTHESPHVDVISFHLYPDHWGISERQSIEYIERHVDAAHQNLRKPVFCGEFGFQGRSDRDRIFQDWYTTFKKKNIDGAIFWILSGLQDDGSPYPDYDGFTVYPDDRRTVNVILDFGQWIAQRNGQILDRNPPNLSLESPTVHQELKGMVTFMGTVTDDSNAVEVTMNFGGAERQAMVTQNNWKLTWDSFEALDGPLQLTLRAKDREGNESFEQFSFLIANNSISRNTWQSMGQKIQDDGYHFIYHMSLHNQSSQEISGHFVARFFLNPEGEYQLGNHYESSQRYVRNPMLSGLSPYHQNLQFYEIDMGQRSVRPGEFLGFKGQISQRDGGFKSYNDWSSGDIREQDSTVHRVAWYVDGRLISGSVP